MLFEKALTVFAVVRVLGCYSCNIVWREGISVASGDPFSTPHIAVLTWVKHTCCIKITPFCGDAVKKPI